MPISLVSIGSNLGDRHATFDQTLELLSQRFDVVEGKRHASTPVGGPANQEGFLNSVVRVRSDATPREMLAELQSLERRHGPREGPRWAPRVLDLDLLLVDDCVIDEPGLRLPHPRMSFRPFVVRPAAELLSEWMHPEIGATLGDLEVCLANPGNRLAVVGEGREADRCVALAEELLAPTGRAAVVRLDRAGLQGPPPGLTIDAAEAGVRCGGPRLRVADCDPGRLAEEIGAAIECVWGG